MKIRSLRSLLWLLLLASLVPVLHAADRSRALPPRYQHWLNQEVNYIITTDERRHFLTLPSDTERDSFIAQFWRIRNPAPGSGGNPYKEEHYRRLAYANEHYGSLQVQDGWRTDMGRIYIILGAPKQIVTYPAARNVRPMEIWFYQSPSPALPPYFSLIFYKRSIGEPYTLYSPNSDGPARLVSSLEAMNDQKKSLDILRKSLGEEVARTSLSLLPGDNVNLDSYEPSLTSDLLLGQIAGLPDNPLTREQLEDNRLREQVTTSLFLGGDDATLGYDVFRDEQGSFTLSYLLEMHFPDPHLLGAQSGGTANYDLTLRSQVITQAGKPVYNQEDRFTGTLAEAQAEIARKKKFGAEERLPLAPGAYTLVATLTNNLNHVAVRQHASVTVPAPSRQLIALSGLLAYTAPAPVPDPQNVLPFSASHYRFTPRGPGSAFICQGQKLPLVFQLWLAPGADGASAPQKIHLHYVFGSIASTHDKPIEEDEVIEAANRDAAGNLLTGHTLDTSSLPPGSYQVVVSAAPVGEHVTAYATLNLHVAAAENYVDTWTVYGPEDSGGRAQDDYKRGLAAAAQGDPAAAESYFTRSLEENPANLRTLSRLAALLQQSGRTQQLAALSQLPLLAHTAVDPGTVLAITHALSSAGNSRAIVALLEKQIALQPPNANLYIMLADACDATGDRTRAQQMRKLAARLQ